MSRNETGLEGKTDSNQEPPRPRNQPRRNAGNELMPKEPAAQKTQLPSILKEKLQRRAQRPGSPHECGLRAADRHSSGLDSPRAVAAASVGLTPAPGLGVRGQPQATRAQRPHPHPSRRPRAVGGETRAKEKDNAGQATPYATRVPSTPSARGRQLPPQGCSSTLLSPPGRRSWGGQPPSSPPPPSSQPGGSRESARRRRARAEWGALGEPGARGDAGTPGEGGAQGSGAHEGSRVRRRARRAAIPRGPAAAPAGFRLKRGLRRDLLSVKSLGPSGLACQPSWPTSPSAPIRKGSRARAGDLVSRQGWGRRSVGIRVPAQGVEEKVK